jgi:GAF domain-containing protein
VLAGELPAFSLRDFIEGGLFEPAQRLLVRSGARGEIRFSILHRDGDDFVMASPDEGLFPALGHSLEGRQQFRMPILESFSLHAYQHGKTFASGQLSEDDRFTPHQKATRPYESIVSIPLWKFGEVDGVLNVVATEPEAFNGVDRSYLLLLGSIIDVTRAAQELVVSEPGQYVDEPEDTGLPVIDQDPNDGPAELPPGPTPQ